MKKIEIKFNKISVKKYAVYLLNHRKFVFMALFGVLFIFTFNVTYKNFYYNPEQLDYVKSRKFENDEAKRNAVFKKIIENMELRERTTQKVKNIKYKNPFIFNDGRGFEKSGDNGDDLIIPPHL